MCICNNQSNIKHHYMRVNPSAVFCFPLPIVYCVNVLLQQPVLLWLLKQDVLVSSYLFLKKGEKRKRKKLDNA